MGVQVTIAGQQVDKQRLGFAAVSLTHFTDTAEPSIASGSKIEISGALYEFTADETGTGWGGIGASNTVYILLTPSGASVSWSYTTTAPTWDTAKQGFYSGSNRVIGGLYKDAGGLYTSKWLCDANCMQRTQKKTIEIGDWNMDTTANVQVPHGLTVTSIRTISAMVRTDDDNSRIPLDAFTDGADPALVGGGVSYADATSISLWRRTGGRFDTTDYNATTYNRGWITIEWEM